jgi:trehalose 6-phosphate synthase
MENRASLRRLIREKLRGYKFLVVSNREPYERVYRDGHTEWIRTAGGVTVALDPVMQASRGIWVAHASGAADKESVDANGYVPLPPESPSYRLKPIWLSKRQEEDYYYGFSNSALWPLCHVAYRRPVFRERHWRAYEEVNEIFADRVAEEVGDAPAFVFIQDYHLALMPRMLRRRCPQALIAQFWHIPWPNPEVFRICPWKQELLEGMLGNDILGFHIRYHCQNFIDTVHLELEARPDREMTAVVFGGHTTKIRAFPISIDFEDVERRATSVRVRQASAELCKRYGFPDDVILGVGADRIDYTKGLPERLEALDVLLEKWPEYRGRLVFFQAGVPSRMHIKEYQQLNQEVTERIAAINAKYGKEGWKPVIFAREHVPLDTLLALYRTARFLIVSSLHDGMNVVAKEFVAAKVNADGVLLLSPFTGAARELRDALVINPFAPEQMAKGIQNAIEMDPMEMRRRMLRLRERVRENNVYKWAGDIIRKLIRLT